MPPLARAGLLILAFGLVADLLYHALPVLTAPLLGNDGGRAHLILCAGMVVVIGGLVEQGLALAHTSSFSERGT